MQDAALRVAAFVDGDPRHAYHPNERRWVPHALRSAFQNREVCILDQPDASDCQDIRSGGRDLP